MQFFRLLVALLFTSPLLAAPSTAPIVTAEKYMEYKWSRGYLDGFQPPEVVLICYQSSTLKHLLGCNPSMKESSAFSHLYFLEGGEIAVFGGWGVGAPALAIKMEELIALGVKKFVAVGTAGTLTTEHQIGELITATTALAEDGVAHLYLQEKRSADADERLLSDWRTFTKSRAIPPFLECGAWSFSAIFKESAADVARVRDLGYDTVEMEAATLYAIGEEKGVQTLALLVISDSLTRETWTPHIKEFTVSNNLHQLAKWALEFCEELCARNSASAVSSQIPQSEDKTQVGHRFQVPAQQR